MKVIAKIIKLIVALFIVALIFILVIQPALNCWLLRHTILTALDDAVSVRVVEHSNRFDEQFNPDYKEKIYSTSNLTPKQIVSLRRAFPLSLDYSQIVNLMCIFEEHHYIQIIRRDGTSLTLHICFHCGEIILGDESGNSRIMPLGWNSGLSGFIASLGLHPYGPWKK